MVVYAPSLVTLVFFSSGYGTHIGSMLLYWMGSLCILHHTYIASASAPYWICRTPWFWTLDGPISMDLCPFSSTTF